MIHCSEFSLSVVITAYIGTSACEFHRAYLSISKYQSLLPNEIIVVCDGLISEELDYLLRELMSSKNVVVFRLKENFGPGYARNFGIFNAKSVYVAVMDSDDVSLPNRFADCRDFFLVNDDFALVGGDIIDSVDGFDAVEDLDITTFDFHRNFAVSRKISYMQVLSLSSLRMQSPMNNVTTMFRRDLYFIVGGYPSIRFGEDYILWARFISRGFKARNLNKRFVYVADSLRAGGRRGGASVFALEVRYLANLYAEGVFGVSWFVFRVLFSFVVRFVPMSVYVWLKRLKFWRLG